MIKSCKRCKKLTRVYTKGYCVNCYKVLHNKKTLEYVRRYIKNNPLANAESHLKYWTRKVEELKAREKA